MGARLTFLLYGQVCRNRPLPRGKHGAKVQVSLEEYLGHNYEPDCDYVDGELIERNVGENWHSKTQGEFIILLGLAGRPQQMAVLPELRMRLRPGSYCIPDGALFAEEPSESVPSTTPRLIVEVVSSDDRFTANFAKLEEFRRPAAQGALHLRLRTACTRSRNCGSPSWTW